MCSVCGMVIIAPIRQVSKGGNGYRPGCEQHLKAGGGGGGGPAFERRAVEVVVREQLLPLITDEAGVPISPEMVDDFRHMLGSTASATGRKKRKVRTDSDGGQACDTDRKRRPDLLFLLRHPETSRITHALNVEIDEHSHENRDVECELSRPDDIRGVDQRAGAGGV